MISNLDILMPVYKYLPNDKYPSNPGLIQGPSMPRVEYSNGFETYSGGQNRSLAESDERSNICYMVDVVCVYLGTEQPDSPSASATLQFHLSFDMGPKVYQTLTSKKGEIILLIYALILSNSVLYFLLITITKKPQAILAKQMNFS